MSIDRIQDHTYIPPITFAELCAAGRISVPGADEELHDELDAMTRPDPDPTSGDRLEAFVDAWGSAGQSPADEPFPSR